MARTKQEVKVSKALNEEIPSFKLGEIGINGISIFNGVSAEEIVRELNPPNSMSTYKLMSMHPAVNSPLNLFDNMVTKAKLRFVPPTNPTEEEKFKTNVVSSMFEDMENSLEDFLHEAMSASIYGFAPIEKVYRYRLKSSGSIYNDGIIGIKKLALRSQKSIYKFIYDDTGNDLIGLSQNTVAVIDPYNRFINKQPIINLPRNKFMLITFGKERQNPYGVSPLREVYIHWKYLQAIEELEAMSVVKDINGLPVKV